MSDTETAFIGCPYCGESIEVLIDCSVDHQEYIEDCSVCCRPINMDVRCTDSEIESIHVLREDE